jgi:hypothetical protein
MSGGTFTRVALVATGLLLSGAACASDVEVRDVGQAKVIIPAESMRHTNEPYAMAGQEQRRPDAWETQGHWINAGQSRVYIPASR